MESILKKVYGAIDVRIMAEKVVDDIVTVPAGAMSPKDIRELNEELQGQVYIAATGTSSHMCNAWVHFVDEFVSKCLAWNRKNLGLDRHSKVLLICDHAPCHIPQADLQLRQNFCHRENVIIPANIGACGQPNDAYHEFLHFFTVAFVNESGCINTGT